MIPNRLSDSLCCFPSHKHCLNAQEARAERTVCDRPPEMGRLALLGACQSALTCYAAEAWSPD